MSTPIKVTTGAEITRLLTRILNVSVSAMPALGPKTADLQRVAWGVYEGSESSMSYFWGLELSLAAAAAAALVLFPPARAHESVVAGRLDETLQENCRELLNVMTRLLNVAGGIHFRLETLVYQEAILPKVVQDRMDRVSERLDLELTIAGYGGGRMTLLMVSNDVNSAPQHHADTGTPVGIGGKR
jgi:hypothetical protein